MFGGAGQNVEENNERRDVKKEKDKGYVAFHSDDDDIGAQGDGDNLAASSIRPKNKKSKKDKSRKESKSRTKHTRKQEKSSKVDKEKVKEKDKKKEKKSEAFHKHQQTLPVFGVSLHEAVKRSMLPDGVQIPRIIRECIMEIEDKGLSQEGIYRLSGVKSKIEMLKDIYNQGKTVDLDDFEPNILAGLIKLFIRELTDTLLPDEVAQKFEDAAAMPSRSEKINQFKELILELPAPNRTLLSWLMVHMLHVLQKGAENKMSVQNIAALFGDTELTRYKQMVKAEVDFSTLSSPEYGPIVKNIYVMDMFEDNFFIHCSWYLYIKFSFREILAELTHQEVILSKLHEDMEKGAPDETEDKDEELWEVQRLVTMLKRKLRDARRKQKEKVVEEQKKQEENKPPAQETIDEEILKRLQLEEMELRFQEEELLEQREQLEKRIQNEKNEIKRLEEEIAELTETRGNNSPELTSDHNSSSGSEGSESEDESELEEIMNDLVQSNKELEEKNEELFKQIHDEQDACLKLKVQIKMMTATSKLDS
ncbi:ralA-binding protein 1-like isoform X2 [Xenia sp. Carnegie-2017]|uniref:ralA-binding protein 1-like isoform X2 n=1 Tax=Xenia sp. Carnegie-2017 TaxID=2897299 RepID=UPI001F037C70|nr:ralA-binding protein 1-like isoform X2 [Xenia sp. Carnegie-2017]